MTLIQSNPRSGTECIGARCSAGLEAAIWSLPPQSQTMPTVSGADRQDSSTVCYIPCSTIAFVSSERCSPFEAVRFCLRCELRTNQINQSGVFKVPPFLLICWIKAPQVTSLEFYGSSPGRSAQKSARIRCDLCKICVILRLQRCCVRVLSGISVNCAWSLKRPGFRHDRAVVFVTCCRHNSVQSLATCQGSLLMQMPSHYAEVTVRGLIRDWRQGSIVFGMHGLRQWVGAKDSDLGRALRVLRRHELVQAAKSVMLRQNRSASTRRVRGSQRRAVPAGICAEKGVFQTTMFASIPARLS